MIEEGRPKHFDLNKFLEAAQMVVDADNVVGAMKMVEDCIPAYYRDGSHDAINLWKANVWERVATEQDYVVGESKEVSKEKLLEEYESFQRMKLVEQTVRQWNEQKREPHIVELGPGEFWLPVGLKEAGLKFTYNPVNITGKVPDHILPLIEDVLREKPEFHHPEFFICFEMIEHIFNLNTPYNYYCRNNVNAEHIFISTPQGTLGGGWKRANAEMIAHVRDFTLDELRQFCMKYWPHMQWGLIDAPQMIAVGSRVNG